MSSLTFIGAHYQAPYAGASITDDLGAFVAMRWWNGKDLYISDCKLFASATGRWLKRCPYAKELQKHFTVYEDPEFDFQTALRDFCRAHGVTRLGYNPDDLTLPPPKLDGRNELIPVPVDEARLARAYLVWPRDTNGSKAALKMFLESQERTAPLLATSYAVASLEDTDLEIKTREERTRELNAAVAAEIEECKQLPGDEVLVEVRGYEKLRWVSKAEAVELIGRYNCHLAKGRAANAK
jgi:hypothetical protein